MSDSQDSSKATGTKIPARFEVTICQDWSTKDVVRYIGHELTELGQYSRTLVRITTRFHSMHGTGLDTEPDADQTGSES